VKIDFLKYCAEGVVTVGQLAGYSQTQIDFGV
jgi:hypothetical protein